MKLRSRMTDLSYNAKTLSMHAVSLDTLIADVPVDATLEKALSPVINPIVQYIISTPALATPLARLLGVNSQLVSCCKLISVSKV